MNANAMFDASSSFELGKVQGRPLGVSCYERSSLCVVVAELLYKNQILRFKLSQSQALVGQLRLAFDQVRAYPDSGTEIEGALNLIRALLKPDLEC